MTTASQPAGYAIVTGAASGIGRAIAERLTSDGWCVAWVDTDSDQLHSVAGDSLVHVMDVSDPQAWQGLHERLRDEWPRLDLLVNNAGVLLGGHLQDCPAEDLARLVDVNLTGVLLGCRQMTPWLIESHQHRPAAALRAGVLNMASVFAAISPPGFAAYSATKAGVVSLSEALRGELAPHGLNVTVAAPGVVRTPLFGRSWFANPAYRSAADRFFEEAELEPAEVADQALQAVSQGKLHAVIGRRARRLWWLKRLLPSFVLGRVASRAERELHRHSHQQPPTHEPQPSPERVPS